MSKIIAVDFDGTVVKHEYPDIGMEVPGAVDTLKALTANGCRIILWTMRSGDFLADAVHWFESRGIDLFGVNENPEQSTWTDSPKAYAQIYIDDAALGCPLHPGNNTMRPYVNWTAVAEELRALIAPETEVEA